MTNILMLTFFIIFSAFSVVWAGGDIFESIGDVFIFIPKQVYLGADWMREQVGEVQKKYNITWFQSLSLDRSPSQYWNDITYDPRIAYVSTPTYSYQYYTYFNTTWSTRLQSTIYFYYYQPLDYDYWYTTARYNYKAITLSNTFTIDPSISLGISVTRKVTQYDVDYTYFYNLYGSGLPPDYYEHTYEQQRSSIRQGSYLNYGNAVTVTLTIRP
ncbi:MAG: hypothetical protein AABY84_04610 [Candidatus Firestonebacteria bacterium]